MNLILEKNGIETEIEVKYLPPSAYIRDRFHKIYSKLNNPTLENLQAKLIPLMQVYADQIETFNEEGVAKLQKLALQDGKITVDELIESTKKVDPTLVDNVYLELFQTMIDKRKLSEEIKAEIEKPITDTFWQFQNIVEITSEVEFFREFVLKIG